MAMKPSSSSSEQMKEPKLSTKQLLYCSSSASKNPKLAPTPWIGGPDTILPRFVESCLSWSLALFCLTISGYFFLIQTVLVPAFKIARFTDKQPWLPLTTCSRSEIDRKTPFERYHQLSSFLKCLHSTDSLSDEELVSTIRKNEICRRLASLAMRPTGFHHGNSVQPSSLKLGKQLLRLWPELLKAPPLDMENNNIKNEISLIVPAYRERGSDVREKLNLALEASVEPHKVQVLLIDAGGCQDVTVATIESGSSSWGEVRLLKFSSGGGRGPCLNFGARHATGRILTFLHSDTRLPPKWDRHIQEALLQGNANACAFQFGIDTSRKALNGGPLPPGIRAVEFTANCRTRWYSLPYGDQCLSLRASMFHHLGGFPDQCLMEDYELIGLLRKRASPSFGLPNEQLKILEFAPALCSPRRWQYFGVLYVTFTNSKCVSRYARGLSPDELYQLYYGKVPPEREKEMSPWEIQLQSFLHGQK